MPRNRAPRRELLSVVDAASEAGCHPVTVVRMINSGQLPAYRVGRRGMIKIDRRDVEEILIRRVRPGELFYGVMSARPR